MTEFPEFSHVGEVLRKVQGRLTAIEAEVRYLRERSAEVEGKIGTIEGRLSAIDQRIDWGHEYLGCDPCRRVAQTSARNVNSSEQNLCQHPGITPVPR